MSLPFDAARHDNEMENGKMEMEKWGNGKGSEDLDGLIWGIETNF